MRRRALVVLAWLAIGAGLVACAAEGTQRPDGTTRAEVEATAAVTLSAEVPATVPAEGPPVPEGARQALDRFFDRAGYGQYALLSAQRATPVDGIDQVLRSQGIVPRRLGGLDEAWCVTTDPVMRYEISYYVPPSERDRVGQPRSQAVWTAQVLLVVRRGHAWQAGPVWDYFEHDGLAGSDGVAGQIYLVLRALGCK